MKFKTILMIAAMLFAIIPMVVFAVFSNNALSASGEKEFTNIVKSVAENQASPLNAVVNTARSDIEFLASVDSVKGAAVSGSSNADADALLKNFADGNALVVGARIVNNSGKIIAGTDSGKDLENASGYSSYKDEAVYFDDASGKTNTNSTMIIKKNFGQCFILISYDIFGDNSLISRICSNAKFYEQGNIMVVDSKGNWSTGSGYNNSSVLNGDIASQLSGLPEGTVSGTFKYTGTDGAENLAAAVKVGGEGGLSAVVSCPTNRAVQFSRNASTTIIVVTIVLSIISAIAAIVVSGLLTAPLKNIQKTLETIRNGDHEARIKNMNNNEYGQLSRAFNNLVDDIVVSEDRYRNISEMSDNIIFEWNFKTNEVVFSNNFNKKFSYRAPSNHFGDSFLLKAKVHPDDLERYRSDLDQLEKGKNFERNEYRIKNIYGDFIWVLMRTATLKDNEGKPVKVVGVMVDIDRGKKSEQQLTERASYDALTELYNRETIENQIENEISLSEMRKSEMAVLFIDVDDFKHYNDNYSHATGDQVLKFLAKTIKTEVEGIGFGGRYGGDEDFVFVPHATAALAERKGNQILEKVAKINIPELDGIKSSIGISIANPDNRDYRQLLKQADSALYQAKNRGKNCVVLFDPNLMNERTYRTEEAVKKGRENVVLSANPNGAVPLIMRIFSLLYSGTDLTAGINQALRFVGENFDVSRVYIFEDSEDGAYCSNTFEWCAEGVPPEIDILQNVSYEEDLGGHYRENMNDDGIFYCRDISELDKPTRAVLEPQGIKSMLQCAILDNGEFKGFVGFDECRENRFWTQEQIDSLVFLSKVLSVFLIKNRRTEQLN